MSSVLEDSNHIAGSIKGKCDVEPELKFYVEFRRHYHYMGEYGFDWMRSTYQYFSEDYQLLKSEYTKSTVEPRVKGVRFKLPPTIVEGQEYFVPWLSFFPAKERKIKLSLNIYFLENMVQSTDKITFLSNDTKIRFSEPVIFLDKHFKQLNNNQRDDLQALKDYRDKVGAIDINSYTIPDLIKFAEACNKTLITKIYKSFFTDTYVSRAEYKAYDTKIKKTKIEIVKLSSQIQLTNEEQLKKLELEKRLDWLETRVLRKLKIKTLKGLTKLIEGGREPVTNIDIILTCKGELSNNTLITVIDKNDKPVGYLKVLKNTNLDDFKFDITPIRVSRSRTKIMDENGKPMLVRDNISAQDKRIIDRDVFGGFDSKGKLQKLEDSLNKESMNQALVQCNINSVVDIVIDEKKWIQDGLIDQNKNEIPADTDITDRLKKVFGEQFKKLSRARGITLFLMPLGCADTVNTVVDGYSELEVIDGNESVIFKTGLKDETTFSHEIAHVLGLEHSFLDEDYSNIEERKKDVLSDSKHVNKIEINEANEKLKKAELKEKIANYEELKELEGLKEIEELEKLKELKLTEINELDNKIDISGDEVNKNQGTIFLKKKVENHKKLLNEREKLLNRGKILEEAIILKKELRDLYEYWVKIAEHRSSVKRKNYFEGWNPHKFLISSTENIMDYYNGPFTFYKFQWLAMQNDIKKYYKK